jgi:hypothetical protein
MVPGWAALLEMSRRYAALVMADLRVVHERVSVLRA